MKIKGKKIIFILVIAIAIITVIVLGFLIPMRFTVYMPPSDKTLFKVQSADTMKLSRDLAERELHNPGFDNVIEEEVSAAVNLGVTHIAIATPYDEEFLPFLTRWVKSARQHGLSVWFRGNFSGWEGWFNYPKIDRSEHIALAKKFIFDNRGLFQDGDIFTPCPECENGGPGDPRQTGDILGHQNFLMDEYKTANDAFKSIGKHVDAGYFSMNADVAKVVMNKDVTSRLGGVVVIDHYVKSVQDMEDAINYLRENTEANIVLGEFGAPIPDLNGEMSESEQASFIEGLLDVLYRNRKYVVGLNYWVLQGGSTGLLDSDGARRRAFQTLALYYKAPSLSGTIVDPHGEPLKGITVSIPGTGYSEQSDRWGNYQIFIPKPVHYLLASAPGFATGTISVATTSVSNRLTVLMPTNPGTLYKLKSFLYSLQVRLGI